MGYFRKGAILAGFGEPPILFKEPQTCNRCGKPALYWAKHSGKWRLHSYAVVGDEKARFHLHRCGIAADGTPSKWPTPTNQETTNAE